MRISFKYAVWLLALLPALQGCDHKAAPAQQQPQALAPPIVDTPPPKPATVSKADLPPPEIGNPQPTETRPPEVKPAETPHKPPHHVKKPATTPPASAPTQEVAKAEPPAVVAPPPSAAPTVSAAGQLSGGASGDVRSETEETINSTEKGVNGITRTLSESEAKTAAQIREFLKQAREALTTGDVDGAHTLVTKAKVLLTELNQ